MKELKELTDPYSRLSNQRDRIETLMRDSVDYEYLIETNPAFYIYLHSSPVSRGDVVTLGNMNPKTVPRRQYPNQFGITLSICVFDLRQYTGKPSFQFDDVQINTGDYFWDLHVDASDMQSYTPLERMKKAQTDFTEFFKMTAEEDTHSDYDEFEAACRLADSNLVVGSISHLGRFLQRVDAAYSYDASTQLPEELLTLYVLLIQMAVDWADATSIVQAKNMRSVVITPQTFAAHVDRLSQSHPVEHVLS